MANGRSSPTLAEIYNTLNQLVDAYGQVMATFGSVVDDVQEIRREVAELRDMMRKETDNAITAARLYKSIAEAHEMEAEKLKVQIEALKSGGC